MILIANNMTYTEMSHQQTTAILLLNDAGYQPESYQQDVFVKGENTVRLFQKWIMFNGKDIDLATLKSII